MRIRNSPVCTLSQNGYGARFSNWNDGKHHKTRSSWTCSHTHGRREGQSETHHDEVPLRLHLGGVLSHATVHYIVLHCTCVLTVPWYTLKLQLSLHCLRHLDAVTMDFVNSHKVVCSLSKHTPCTFLFFLYICAQKSLGWFPSFFPIAISVLVFAPYSKTTCPIC